MLDLQNLQNLKHERKTHQLEATNMFNSRNILWSADFSPVNYGSKT